MFRDTTSYLVGVALLSKQAGIVLTPPMEPNTMLIAIGALLVCNPALAQFIVARFGGSPTGSTTERQSSPSEEQRSSGRQSLSASDGAD